MDLPRQPLPVVVTIDGVDSRDVDYWVSKLKRIVDHQGCDTQMRHGSGNIFTIYPRAVND